MLSPSGGTLLLMLAGAVPAALMDPENAGSAALLLGLSLVCALGLLLFWGLPVGVAALMAWTRREPPVSALLWAGALGWIGVLIYHYRHGARLCPHCHTRIIAEAAVCYWCGGETRPGSLELLADG